MGINEIRPALEAILFAAGDSVTAVSDGGKIIFVKNGDKVSEDPDA